MRTEEDLSQSLSRRAATAPDGTGMVEQARAGVVRIRHRRRILQGAATVVAVAAAALTVPLALREGTMPPPAEPAPPFRSVAELSVSLAPGSDFVIPWRNSNGNREEARVAHSSEIAAARPEELTVNQGATVQVYDPGTFDPAGLRTGEPVSAAGRQAWYTPNLTIVEDMTPLHAVTEPAQINGPALGWQEASGAWVVLFRLTATAQVRAELIEVAQDLRIQDPPQRVSVPYRFGWLPQGLAVTAVDLHDLAQLSTSASVAYGYTGQPAGKSLPPVIVYAVPGKGDRDWETIRPDLGAPQRAGGHDFWYLDTKNRAISPPEGGSVIVMDTGTCHLQLSFADRARIPEPDAMRIVQELTVADCADLSTWLPLT
ncbi:hypothetical protein FB565_008799 [Actinoplanes lutulentus]|uniref:Uncharacterized protein n=1 Tax=Actinoplanes lutulentus TaxID=1287878 RepID=A0A327Z0U5_9ACTN|nr:hypothetical protein [Actinoplanes lutulentus]MBB2949013.1 hypothetical protein [Actinoplanes lutulentus]RAK26209.1 hypothetical protein B0I29_12841 [Actinoplanes lutulentus]